MCFNVFRPAGLAIAIILAVSCVEPISLDPMEEMPVVVICALTTETTEQSLDLFYAKRPSETRYVSIPDAKVVVSAEGRTYNFKWNGEKYVCSFSPAYNTLYRLDVETPEGVRLSAETTMPKHFSLLPQDNLHVLEDYSSGELSREQQYAQYRAYYFALETETGAEPYTDELYAWISAGDRLSTNHKDADSFNLLANNWNDLKSHPFFERKPPMSPEQYLYFSAFPAFLKFIRIHQKQGFRGTVSEAYAETTKRLDHMFYLNSDVVDDRIATAETIGLDTPHNLEYPSQNEYCVRFVSKEYDAFLKEVVEKTVVRADELAVIYSTEPIPSNILGGLGIFGAEAVGSAPFFCKCIAVYVE